MKTTVDLYIQRRLIYVSGAFGGAIWHAVKGYRNSPIGSKRDGMIKAVRQRAPILGGAFAVWGMFFSSFDCSFMALRGVEDPWNSIMAGAATGGTLAARAGWKAIARSSAMGGVLLGLIEGLGVMMNNVMAPAPGGFDEGESFGFAPPLSPPMVETEFEDMEASDSLRLQHEDVNASYR